MELLSFNEYLNIKYPIVKSEGNIKGIGLTEQELIAKQLKTKTITEVAKEMGLKYNWVWRIYNKHCK
jgi:hypothetical protein